jgi:hypothetical protein
MSDGHKTSKLRMKPGKRANHQASVASTAQHRGRPQHSNENPAKAKAKYAARRKYWQSYIADLQGRMLLGNWDIVLRPEPPPAGDYAGAQVVFRDSTREVRMYLSGKFDGFTRTEQRRCIVHELVHVHLFPLAYHLGIQCGSHESEKVERECIECGHGSHEEFAVDDLARIIAPHMPLPVKP